MKLAVILVIAILILFFTYFSYRGDIIKASICGGFAAIAAVLTFVAPYIIEAAEEAVEETEEERGAEPVLEEPDDLTPEHIHNTFAVKEENLIPATCVDSGSYERVSYCECGEELEREIVVLEALGHDYVKSVTEPTCEQGGFTTYRCSRCNDSYEEEPTEALGHIFVEGICSRCSSVSPDFATLITSKAMEFVNTGKYEEAKKMVSEAIDKADNEELRTLYANIEIVEANAAELANFTVGKANFAIHSGSINNNGDMDTYNFTAPIDGMYRFSFSGMVNGFEIRVSIVNADGKRVDGYTGLGNNSGITVELKKECDYTVKVESYNGTGDYVLKIWQQKTTIDITAKEKIYDCIEYRQQQNEYVFIPPISGIYRFDFYDVVNNVKFGVYIYDYLNYKVGGYNGVGNKSGIDVKLKEGEVYRVQVRQYDGVGDYTLVIGKQKPTQNITGKSIVTGKITYTNQKDIYMYTPSYSGEYKFLFSNMVNGFEVGMDIRDSLDYKVGGAAGLGNEWWVKAELEKGETYMIYVTQYIGSGEYMFKIS